MGCFGYGESMTCNLQFTPSAWLSLSGISSWYDWPWIQNPFVLQWMGNRLSNRQIMYSPLSMVKQMYSRADWIRRSWNQGQYRGAWRCQSLWSFLFVMASWSCWKWNTLRVFYFSALVFKMSYLCNNLPVSEWSLLFPKVTVFPSGVNLVKFLEYLTFIVC